MKPEAPTNNGARKARRLISPAKARELCGGITESSFKRLSKQPGFPRPIKLGVSSNSPTVWDADELAEFLDAVAENREAINALAAKQASVAGKASWGAGSKRNAEGAKPHGGRRKVLAGEQPQAAQQPDEAMA